MRSWNLLPLTFLVLASGCGDEETPVTSSDDTTSTSSSPATGEVRYTTTAMVLESPDHGPQLCLGAIGESYPPRCGGPDVVGWDWEAAPAEESAHGTTWGEYTVVGIWDGEAMTLTEPPRAPDPDDDGAADGDRLGTPCPTPEGGWQVVDATTATTDAMDRATMYARMEPDVGGVWLDQSINPAAGRERVDELAMNDPTQLILNISFTGDLERHEAAVRDLWGGSLCISHASRSATELEAIRQDLHAELDPVWFSSINEVRGRVEIGVTIDDGLQEQLDERYGAGVVVVRPALEPITG